METFGRRMRAVLAVALAALLGACGGNLAASSASGSTIPVILFSPFASTSVFLMTCAMAAMGLHTEFAMLRRAGLRVLYAGLAAFGCMAALAFALIRVLRIP